jgi:predicted outer membrane repeat protein
VIASPRNRKAHLWTLVLLVLCLALPAPVSAAATACLVTNLDTGPQADTLQAAVDAASPSHRLTVEGTCYGTTVIGKDLVISGIETETSGRPTLDGDGLGSVVTVLGAVVTIEDLMIEDGAATVGEARWQGGGGILQSAGTLTLRDVVVHRNTARRGGGIASSGTLILAGATRITGNDAEERGGGVKVIGGRLTMNDASSISQNDAGGGSGVYLDGGTLTMNDRSSIRGNRFSGVRADRGTIVMNDRSSIRGHPRGGGVRTYAPSTLTMNGHSSIRGNAAGNDGGGVDLGPRSVLTMNDASTITRNTAGVVFEGREGGGIYVHGGSPVRVICAPRAGANVFGNAPDDCIRNGQPF